jgi:hypothetical protein
VGVVSAVAVWFIYQSFPADHYLHKLNWAMSYCTVAILIAAIARLALDLGKPET